MVGLLQAALSFLAFNGFVYLLGAFEVAAGLLLFAGIGLNYVGLLSMGGTIVIFLIAPAVSYGENGFPFLALPGEFLLKDLVLFSASMSLISTGASNSQSTQRKSVKRMAEAMEN